MATADSRSRAIGAKRTKKKAAQKKAAQSPRKTMSSDRLSALKRTGVTAGKPSGTMAQRAKQNAGVKDGTIRLGANGKSYNVFDAKTQTWKRGIVTGTSKPKTDSKPAPKPSSSSSGGDFESWFKKTYPDTPYPGPAAGKAKAKRDNKGKKWWEPGGGGLVGSNKK